MSDKYQRNDKINYLPVYNRWPVTLVKGKGAYVWDSDNKKYIDALAGIAVNSVGHCHPKVVKAIQKQSKKLIHISNFYLSKPQARLAKELTKLSGFDRVFFSNSGAEANETAFKIARKYASSKGRGGTIISFEGCFHGRTLATIATGKRKYQEGFDPIPKGFVQLPFNNIDAVKKIISSDIAAFIIEPVQGEGGIHIADYNFLVELREICNNHDIVLIFDEIQCGMGRTGEFFAYEHYQVKPDILTLAKALGGGFPVSATLFNEKITQGVQFGDHGTTFGGNPLACAAALAAIKTIKKEKLVNRSKMLGEKIKLKIENLAKTEGAIKEIRGIGLMIGIELNFEGRPVVVKLLKKGILGNVTADNVIRLVPPLTIKEKEIEYVVKEVFNCIKEVKKDA
ncbi:MAG: aspartate aminotransferase family protein [Bacteroidales bacterium]|nr:aspartate aminotransferase family protein [Bacteroidales bacterium]